MLMSANIEFESSEEGPEQKRTLAKVQELRSGHASTVEESNPELQQNSLHGALNFFLSLFLSTQILLLCDEGNG